MPRDSDVERIRSLFRGAAPRYDAVVRATTLGMDLLWKRRLLDATPRDRPYGRILDLACGTGIVTSALARRYPDAEVVGLDVSREMLSVARRRNGRANARFVQLPAEAMETLGTGAFDLVTASYLPKYTDVHGLADGTRAVLADPGAAVFHDFTYPRSWPYRAGFEAYWAVLRRLLPHVDGYTAISASLRELVVDASDWPEALGGALRRAGFDRVEVRWQPL
jgi:demethylmenaquinone methyltransferase/2-methoxy-6-polyprenyl-1,4-benzoquinol methylase